jgi:hypothetical protein
MMLLADLVSEGLRLVVIVNRFDEIPFATHLGLLGECRLLLAGSARRCSAARRWPSWLAPKPRPPVCRHR